jgi:hypothetical protein
MSVTTFDWLVLLWLAFLFGFAAGAWYDTGVSEGSIFPPQPEEGSHHDES